MQEKILKAPYFAQNDQSIDPNNHLNSCGILCVAMLLAFYQNHKPNIMDLIDEGILIGGYKDGMWHHEALVRILRNHGINAYAEEFRSVSVDLQKQSFDKNQNQEKLIENGIEKISQEIENGNPVIVSMKEGFGGNNQSHLVLVVGHKKDGKNLAGLYVHDPDFRSQKGTENRLVSISDFKNFWRNFAIFSYLKKL